MFSSMGMELGLSVVVGFLIELAGRMARNRPLVALLVFGAAGIIAGYRSIFRLLKKCKPNNKRKNLENEWGKSNLQKSG